MGAADRFVYLRDPCMSNDALYEQQLEESGSYRAAMEKVLIRSFYDNQEDLHDFLFSIYYSFVPVTRFVDRLPRELYELYLEKVYLHERRVRAIIDIADPQDGETALDLACDIGAIGHFLSNQGLAVLGLDLDWGPLKRCNSLWPTETRPMPIVQGNGRHLPYRVDSFDLVVAADFYEHIDTATKNAVTAEVLRALKPGGRLVIHTDNLTRYNLSMRLRKLKDVIGGRDPSKQKHHFAETHTDVDSADHILEIITAHGFRLKKMTYFPGRFKLDKLIVRIPIIRRWLASSYLMSLEKPK